MSIDAAAVIAQHATHTRGASPRPFGTQLLALTARAASAPVQPWAPLRFDDLLWLDDARRQITGAGLRAHAARNLAHVAELIAHYCDRKTLQSRPTIAVLEQLTGLCRRTVQNCCRWLERAGLLLVTEPGTTPQYAPGRLRPDDANLAREWHLVVPRRRNLHPSPAPTAPAPIAGAREDPPGALTGQDTQNERRSAACSFSLAPPPWRARQPEWPLGQTPQRRGERLTAAETLQRRHVVLRRLSARRLRSILRPWFGSLWGPGGAGWTPYDVLYALEHTPDGRPHRHGDPVRDPASWLAHRLSFWLGPDGQPLRPHSAELADQAAEHRARQAAARDQAAAAAAAAADPAGWAAQARAGIEARLGLSPGQLSRPHSAELAEQAAGHSARQAAARDQAAKVAAAGPVPWAARIRAQLGWAAPGCPAGTRKGDGR